MSECTEPGNWQGQCCCTCKHQVSLRQHPWNKIELFKGSIMNHVAYGCGSPELEGSVIIFESKHGCCEVWDKKNDEL